MGDEMELDERELDALEASIDKLFAKMIHQNEHLTLFAKEEERRFNRLQEQLTLFAQEEEERFTRLEQSITNISKIVAPPSMCCNLAESKVAEGALGVFDEMPMRVAAVAQSVDFISNGLESQVVDDTKETEDPVAKSPTYEDTPLLFDEMPVRDFVSWAALSKGTAQESTGRTTEITGKVYDGGGSMNLKGCFTAGQPGGNADVYLLVGLGVSNAPITMYGKGGCWELGKEVFRHRTSFGYTNPEVGVNEREYTAELASVSTATLNGKHTDKSFKVSIVGVSRVALTVSLEQEATSDQIKDAVKKATARTSNLTVEMGQVHPIISVTIGSLACNKLDFVNCSIAGVSYGRGSSEVQISTERQLAIEKPSLVSKIELEKNAGNAAATVMVLFEIISGRKNTEQLNNDEGPAVFFPKVAARKLIEGDVPSLLDPRLAGDGIEYEISRVCHVTFWCIQADEFFRPTMGQVVQMWHDVVVRNTETKCHFSHEFWRNFLSSGEGCTFKQTHREKFSWFPCLQLSYCDATPCSLPLARAMLVMAETLSPILFIKGDPRARVAAVVWLGHDTHSWVRKSYATLTGEVVHASDLKVGLELDLSVAPGLIGFYTNFECLEDVVDVSPWMPVMGVIAWTRMLTRFVEIGRVGAVLEVLDQIPEQDGSVFVHCCQGVSRSTSLVIAYFIGRKVIENIGFLNHVRYLFPQLGSVPGALWSDVTQKSRSKNSLVSASFALPGFTYPSQEFCSQAVRSLHAIYGECSHQPDHALPSFSSSIVGCHAAHHDHFSAEPGLISLPSSLTERPSFAIYATLSVDYSFLLLAASWTNSFTAAPHFVMAVVWLLGFGSVLLLISCYCCCYLRGNYSYSHLVSALSLNFLLLFTCTTFSGCIVLHKGQGKIHGRTSSTLDYVVGQANFVVNLTNFSGILPKTKTIGMGQILTPAAIGKKIDTVGAGLYVFSTYELGISYIWYGYNLEDLRKSQQGSHFQLNLHAKRIVRVSYMLQSFKALQKLVIVKCLLNVVPW